jgi:N-acetylmuramoyl-L-alanine amidase
MNDKKLFVTYVVGLMLSSILTIVAVAETRPPVDIYEPIAAVQEETTTKATLTDIQEPTTESIETEVEDESEKCIMDDVELLALVTVAEAEGESEYGKRLVIDTVLNRVDDPRFPNTIQGVVYQKNQFTSMWNGRVDRCVVTDDVRQLVLEELESRTNSDVIFFQMYNYSPYGTAMFKEGCHYFSSY